MLIEETPFEAWLRDSMRLKTVFYVELPGFDGLDDDAPLWLKLRPADADEPTCLVQQFDSAP